MTLLPALIEEICKDYAAPTDQPQLKYPQLKYPQLAVHLTQEGQKIKAADKWLCPIDESFAVHAKKGKVTIAAHSEPAAAYGASLVQVIAKSGHLGEYERKIEPHFSLRPLWLTGKVTVKIAKDAYLDIPQFIKEGVFDDCLDNFLPILAKRLFSLGYNALVIGAIDTPSQAQEILELISWQEEEVKKFVSFLLKLKSYGIQIIVKPRWQISSMADLSLATLSPFIEAIDILFYEGKIPPLHDPQLKKGLTSYDWTLAELQLLEKKWNKPLIYYSLAKDEEEAKRQAPIIERLLADAGEQTLLAFSAKSGRPTDESQALHPLFANLRCARSLSSTKLLPLVNAGMIENGEGLWPLLPLSSLSAVAKRMYRHPFAGFICLTAAVPQNSTLLDASLWIAGQLMWQGHSGLDTELLAQTWFLAERPDLSSFIFKNNGRFGKQCDEVMHLFYQIKKGIHEEMASEQVKYLVHQLLSSLGQLSEEGRCLSENQTSPSLATYLHYFTVDLKKLLTVYLQNAQLPLPNLLNQNELSPSFFVETQKVGNGPGRLRLKKEVGFKAGDSGMEAFYEQNRLLD